MIRVSYLGNYNSLSFKTKKLRPSGSRDYFTNSKTLVGVAIDRGALPLVCVQAGSTAFVQTRLDSGSLFVFKHQSPALCFKHVWIVVSFFVYKHQSPALCFDHAWIVIPCMGTSTSLRHVSQTRLVCGSLSVNIISPQPCLKHVSLWFLVCVQAWVYCFCSNTFGQCILVCLQASVLSQNGYGWYCLHGSDVNFVFLHVISGLDF